ncbi:MAG: AAA family ATPase, partial [Hydrogenobacter sp.]
MRPILLELENFTVYRRQSVDFSDLNFFIIQGRTGAGKTSLIDAICYALYGKVPKYKGVNLQEYLISKGQRYMRVRLEFSVKGKRYLVDRLYELSKPQMVRFYEGSKPINLKVKEVEDYISKILGMDYETFTKVIVLPQGQFDRFLKPQKPTERREILNRLLGYDEIFERMNRIIKDTLNQLKAKKDALEIEYENLKDFTQESIINMELKLKEMQKQIEALEKEKEVLSAKREQAIKKENMEKELSEKRQKLSELLDKQKEMNQKQERLNIAKEVSEYEQYLEDYEQLGKKKEELIEERKKLEDERIKYKEELQNVEEEFR